MERERRLLKDERDSAAADLTEFPGADLEKILTFEQDGATSDVTVRRKKPQDRRRKRALTRPGFTKDAQNFARHQVETYS